VANRITTLFDLDSKGFDSGLKKLRKSVSEADGAVNKLKVAGAGLGDVLKANAGAAAASAGAALVAFGVKSVKAFQDTALAAGKFADATGIAVEDASRLVEVAGDIGIESGAVEGALLKMNKALADGKGAFAEYGVEIVKTKSGLTDSNATFVNALTTIGAIEDPTLRAKAAQEVFGKSYASVARLMEMSAGDLKAALAGVSDEQAITDAENANAEKFEATMDNLKDKLDGVTLSVGGGLVPALTDLADAVAGFDDAARKAGASGGLGDVLRAAWENSGGYDLIDGLGRIGNLLGDSGDEVEDFGGRMEYYASRVKAAAQETASSTRTEEEANEAREEAERLTKAVTTAVDARRKAEQDLRNELLAAIDKNYAYRVAVDDAEEALSEYNEATKTGKLTTEELDDATRETGRQLYETAAAYAESKGAATGSQEAIDGMIESLYTQMSTLDPNSPLRLELLAYIEELGRIPTDIETKMRVTRFGDVGFEKRAKGGPVRAGEPYIVGEEGPELVVPSQSGTVLTAGETRAALSPVSGAGSGTGMASGSAGITVNIYPKALPTDRELIDLVNSVRRRNGNVI
jgi:hypothetical protein